MGFEQDWKTAKKTFEANAGKKKPSDKFLGAFRKGTGLEKAAKGLDSALAKPTVEGLQKAGKEYMSAMGSYVKILDKALKDDSNGSTYKAEVEKLKKEMEKIASGYRVAAKAADKDHAPKPLIDQIGNTAYAQLANSKFPSNAGIKAFITNKAFAMSGVDGTTKLPTAASAQQISAKAVKDYQNAMKELKAEAKKKYPRKEAFQKAYEIYTDAGAAVGPMEGFLNGLAEWKSAQEQAFAKAGQKAAFGGFITGGPLTGDLKKAGTACSSEQGLLNKVEVYLDKNR